MVLDLSQIIQDATAAIIYCLILVFVLLPLMLVGSILLLCFGSKVKLSERRNIPGH
ncbi:hypothetical protein P13BB106kb_p081 [Pectobacterium phage DU_PP_V]|uniref:Uncharacterized protein n=1 Tax=Pectobacterium phage DU_PP_V TaxID=2041492 RepID=A0A2D2W6Z3_9CAUD|nr:hypothetical protein HOS40_gp088 [Pectobacterium phage DU_PP_V]ATS94065.1 hypothetical protein P13BB106kb_p081 [Pectobacterium phage DU_PP_V]